MRKPTSFEYCYAVKIINPFKGYHSVWTSKTDATRAAEYYNKLNNGFTYKVFHKRIQKIFAFPGSMRIEVKLNDSKGTLELNYF